jgi:hypothetical protein
LDQANDDDDQRDHEQEVDESAADVKGEEAERPQDEEDDRQSPQHGLHHPRVWETELAIAVPLHTDSN